VEKKASKDLYYGIVAFLTITQVALVLIMSKANNNKKETVILSLWRASFLLSSAIMWDALFIMTFVYALVCTMLYIEFSHFRVPFILILCIIHLFGAFKWMVEASRYIVLFNSFKMNGILFVSLGALGVILFSLLIVLVIFWRHESKIEE
jgi:4-amino-4-deoxy-L-arabinose transferase-like glycosyltransferase